MCFRLVPKSMTLNDLEHHNDRILRYLFELGNFDSQLRQNT